jgi:hypothetical protein
VRKRSSKERKDREEVVLAGCVGVLVWCGGVLVSWCVLVGDVLPFYVDAPRSSPFSLSLSAVLLVLLVLLGLF